MEKYFSFDRLSVGYKGKPLIRDICLDIKKGEIVTLIGPNGAGKSTILKSITRQLERIGGSVVLDGTDIQAMSYKSLASRMAVVLTDRIKAEMMTCHDIVASGRYPYTGRLGILTAADEQKVEEALKMVHAEDLGMRDFANISDGQRQRVLLARAICQEPDVMILDEPTSFLDVKYKLELLAILRQMAKEKGITVIMSLHEIDLAEKVADRILTVKGDTQFGYGAPGEIFEEQAIRRLYDIEDGYFDPLFGSIELKKPAGETPEIFVLAGAGTGIPLYRKLQRENIPFATGILYTNDLDHRLARLLAAEVISAPPFRPIPEETLDEALNIMRRCRRVILAGPEAELPNAPLLTMAKAAGISIQHSL